MKVEQDSKLWYWADPGFLDYEKCPFKLDVSWIPVETIPQCVISKYLGDYGLHDELEIVWPPHLLNTPSKNNRRMPHDFNFINSPYTLDDPPAGMEPAPSSSKSEEKRPIE